MSWATQSNQMKGSEKEFVRKCKQTYGDDASKCTTTMMSIMNNNKFYPDIIGVQEAVYDTKTNTTTSTYLSMLGEYNYYWSGKHVNAYALIAVRKDLEEKLGKGIKICDYNLRDKGINDGRPVIVVYFETCNLLVVNLHSPHKLKKINYNKMMKNLENNVKEGFEKAENINIKTAMENMHILMMGDFNDHDTQFINDTHKTITFMGKILHILFEKQNTNTILGLTFNASSEKQEIDKIPKTCCYPKNTFTSDYIFSTTKPTYFGRVKTNNGWTDVGYKKRFDNNNNNDVMGSDHDPVMAEWQNSKL